MEYILREKKYAIDEEYDRVLKKYRRNVLLN